MGKLFFRFRGLLLAPYGLLLLILGKPSFLSFALGLSLALLGESLRLWGVGYAGKSTRKSVLDAPKLVTSGPYALIRHPLYIGNSFMGLGGAIMASGHQSALIQSLFFLAFLFFYGVVYGVIIPLEEQFLEKQFGIPYLEYKKKVPQLIPTGKSYPVSDHFFSWSVAFNSETHTLIPFAILVAVLGLKIR